NNLAGCYSTLGRDAEALALLEEVLSRRKAKHGSEHPATKSALAAVAGLRLRAFAKAGDAAGCRATAELWEGFNPTTAGAMYNAACFRAVTAGVLRPTDVPAADGEADRAMAWLTKA